MQSSKVMEDPSALRRWMVAGPEISRLVANYETVSGTKDAKKSNRHHEQTETVQRAFFEKVKQLTMVMEEMGNPFEEESGDLLTLEHRGSFCCSANCDASRDSERKGQLLHG